MRPALLVSVVALAAVARAEAPPIVPSGMPWIVALEGTKVAFSTEPSTIPVDLPDNDDPSCGDGSRITTMLHADIGGPAGVETIVGSFAGGLQVIDAEGHRVASTPGYPCIGSADELDAIAVGSAWGQPTIALVLTTGGRREASTWVGLYHLTPDRALRATFSGEVEHYQDGRIRRGWILFLPGALLHREPTGPIVLWKWSPVGLYLPIPLSVMHARD